VVWQDNRTGYWEIFIYNLTSAEERHLTSNQGYTRNPSIYRDIITWSSLRFGDTWDIYVHNLSTGETRQITEEGKPWRNRPKIFGNIIVWDEGMRYREVYSYDLETGEQRRLSSP
jgi:beta propeller repeat protein